MKSKTAKKSFIAFCHCALYLTYSLLPCKKSLLSALWDIPVYRFRDYPNYRGWVDLQTRNQKGEKRRFFSPVMRETGLRALAKKMCS